MKDSKVRVAYVKPGASLSHYTKIALLDCFVDFKKNWARDYNLDQFGLEGRVSNLDVNAPDVMRSGRGSTWVQSAGEMTLYMEFYDSATNELIGRVVDPQAADNTGMGRSSSVSNKGEADLIIRRWAKLLIDRLGEITQAP